MDKTERSLAAKMDDNLAIAANRARTLYEKSRLITSDDDDANSIVGEWTTQCGCSMIELYYTREFDKIKDSFVHFTITEDGIIDYGSFIIEEC